MRNLVLGDSLEVLIDHRGKTPQKLGGDFSQSGVPVVSAMLVRDGRLAIEEARRIPCELYRRWMKVPTRKHDVLLTSEAPLGRVALVPDDSPLVLGQRLFGLRGRDGVLDSRYLFYALQADSVQAELAGRSSGTTVSGIRQSELVQLRIPAPSFDQQVSIAEILLALDSNIDSATRIVAACRSLGDGIFRRGYEVAPASSNSNARLTLGQLAADGRIRFGDGYRTRRSEHGQPGLPILRVADVANGYVAPSLEDFVSNDYRSAMGEKVSQSGDVVVTTKGTVGRVALIAEDAVNFVYSPQLCYFRPSPSCPFSSPYLFYWFRSEAFWFQVRRFKGQTDMADYVNLADIRSLEIELPQYSILRNLCQTLERLEALVEQQFRKARSLADLRNTLLPRLISGEIRIRDAAELVEEGT